MPIENTPIRPDNGDWGAIVMLASKYRSLIKSSDVSLKDRNTALGLIHDAILHLSRPDRALYPKIRGQRKTERRRNG